MLYLDINVIYFIFLMTYIFIFFAQRWIQDTKFPLEILLSGYYYVIDRLTITVAEAEGILLLYLHRYTELSESQK